MPGSSRAFVSVRCPSKAQSGMTPEIVRRLRITRRLSPPQFNAFVTSNRPAVKQPRCLTNLLAVEPRGRAELGLVDPRSVAHGRAEPVPSTAAAVHRSNFESATYGPGRQHFSPDGLKTPSKRFHCIDILMCLVMIDVGENGAGLVRQPRNRHRCGEKAPGISSGTTPSSTDHNPSRSRTFCRAWPPSARSHFRECRAEPQVPRPGNLRRTVQLVAERVATEAIES